METARRIRIGEWTVTPGLNLVERDGSAIRIEPRAMDVLVHLARHGGDVVSVDRLIGAVWKDIAVGDGSVYVAIKQLRSALDQDGASGSHIETIPKRGYRLTVPVECVGDRSSAPAAAAVPTLFQPALSRDDDRLRRRLVVAAAVSSVLLAGALALGLRPSASLDVVPVVVLPFVNLSSDREQEYFVDGVTDEIRTVLSRIAGVRVTGRTSSVSFRNKDEDLRAIANALDVQYAVEGSVRRAGSHVRVQAQLTDARTQAQLWSHTYERGVDDIFTIQDEIASSVATALQISLRVGTIGRTPGMTRNVAAYDEYLRGIALFRQLRAELHPMAIEQLKRAVVLDSSFSMAWVALSNVYRSAAASMPQNAPEWQRDAREALARARALTPHAPAVLVQTSIDLLERGKWIEAGAVHQRAVDVYARNGIVDEAAAARGFLLLSVGRAKEAVEAFARARIVDPLMPTYAFGLAYAHLAAGDSRAALAEVDRARRLDGSDAAFPGLHLLATLATGDSMQIRNSVAAPHDALGINRALGRYVGNRSAGANEIRRLATTSTRAPVKATLAAWAGFYEQPELALDLLHEFAPRSGGTWMAWTPVMREARRLPGFKQLVRDIGLVSYWQRYGWSDFCRPRGSHDLECH